MKKSIETFDLRSTERIFAIANTPSFLQRKLRDDQSVRLLAETFTSNEILRYLKKTLKKRPNGLGDIVRPYALLVALSWFQDSKFLRLAAQLEGKHAPWFPTIAKALVEGHIPITYTKIRIPPRTTLTAKVSL